MTSKERIRTAFARKQPDRVPVFANFVPEKKKELEQHFGIDNYYEITRKLGNDMLMASAGIENSYYGEGEEYVCDWGCTWKYFENESGRYTEIVGHPLADDVDGSKLKNYQIPDPDDEAAVAPAQQLVHTYGNDYWICASLACTIFEAGWYIHGLEETIMDMAARPDYAHALFDTVMQYPLRMGKHMIDAGVDMIWLGDDVGMQEAMMISPDMWRIYLKPRMKLLIDTFKQQNPEIVIAYHSCGYIVPIIDELIEIGLDVLNPIQPLSMDPAQIKEAYGDRLSFWGGICVQQTLPRGSVQDIYNEVALRMQTIGKGGGYLMGPAHTVQADTSLENILAFYDAAHELGVYR